MKLRPRFVLASYLNLTRDVGDGRQKFKLLASWTLKIVEAGERICNSLLRVL